MAELGQRAGSAPDAKVTISGNRPPSGPATAAPADPLGRCGGRGLRAPPLGRVPRPPGPSGSATANPRSPWSPLAGGSLTLHSEPLRVPYHFPNPDPAELTPQEPGAEGASSLPRGPRIGSAPRGPLSLRSGPLLFSPVPRQEFRDHRSCTCGRRHPLPSSLEMERGLRRWGLTTPPTFFGPRTGIFLSLFFFF